MAVIVNELVVANSQIVQSNRLQRLREQGNIKGKNKIKLNKQTKKKPTHCLFFSVEGKKLSFQSINIFEYISS